MTERVPVPPPGWDAAGLATLGDAIGFSEGRSRYIGGWVRDTLAGVPAGDLDIGTQLLPQAVKDRTGRAGLTVWSSPSGIAHGTVGVVIEGKPVEVTTLRRDVSTDGRRATVAFTESWEEDAARRDFTINALSADPVSGEVFDYFGGIGDLRNGTVRFIGEPLRRIAEDHLRILRFFRFHARFGRDAPEPTAYDACAARANDLMALSRERIADELLKLLGCTDPAPAIGHMLARDILKPVLPEIDSEALNRLNALIATEAAAGVHSDAVRRLAALVPQDPVLAEDIATRLKLSNAIRKRLVTAVTMRNEPPQALAYRIGVPGAVDRMLLTGQPEQAAGLSSWTPPRLPISGGALVQRGVSAGPLVAKGLKTVEDRWIAAGFPGAAAVEFLADQVAGELLRDQKP